MIRPSSTVVTSSVSGWSLYESINDIRDLAFAPDGTLWAATPGGLVHWNLDAETYTRYPIYAGAVAIASDGSLWLGVEQGVCRFEGVSCESYSAAGGLNGKRVFAITAAPDGTVFVGTERGVSRFDGDSWHSYPAPVATHDLAVADSSEVWAATAAGVGRYLPAEDRWITYTEDHGLPTANAQVIAAGPDGEVFVYLVWEGVYRFDGAGWQEVEGAGALVSDMAFASDGTAWATTTGSLHYPGGSLSYYDGTQWRDAAGDQALLSFSSVAAGPGDVVAAGTHLGLGLYAGGSWRLLRDGPTSNRVTSVAITPDGAAWFAFGDHSTSTPGLGLSRFDGRTWQYYLDGAEVNVLAAGPDGTLWAGVGCNIRRFDGTVWEVVALCEDLPAGNVLDIDFTPDGTIWVTNGMSVASFDGQAWTVHDRLVHSLDVAPDGTLWANGWEGTQGSHCTARFVDGAWTTLKGVDSCPGGFAVSAVTPDGLLWGTTPDGRLASFDGQSWTDAASWRFYDPPEGLPGQVALLSVAPDGALWLAIGDDIGRFDPGSLSDKAWTVYTQEDGLPASHHWAMAFGLDGEIWFGATRFQLDQAEANPLQVLDSPRQD